MPAFKFDSTSFFLTYPQSDIEIDVIINALREVGDIEWARVCRELHADGNPHIHAVGKFTKRVQSRNPRVFDVQGRHPKIEPIRSIKKALDYVSKDGEFRDFGSVPTGGRATARDIAELATTASEHEYFIAAAEARLPYQYALRFWSSSSKQDTIDESYQADITRERFDICLHGLSEESATVVQGPTGIGKTSWAKRVAPKPALWVRHLDVLRQFRAGYHKSIIFDDMSFSHMPRTAQIHLVDTFDDAHVHCRYGHATIPAGVTRIFTCNEYPFVQDAAIARRVKHLSFE